MGYMTKPRLEALRDLARGPQRWHENWPPGKWLVYDGLATKAPPIGIGHPKFTITEAGREVLKRREQ
jgi:hypothetical protein